MHKYFQRVSLIVSVLGSLLFSVSIVWAGGSFGVKDLNKQGVEWKNLGDLEQAESSFTQAIEVDPSLAAVWNNRCHVKVLKGDYLQALVDCNQALVLDPDLAAAWNNRGLAWVGLDKSAKAIDDFSRAIEIEPKFIVAFVNRSKVYTSIGEDKLADKDMKKAEAFGKSNKGKKFVSGKGQLKSIELDVN